MEVLKTILKWVLPSAKFAHKILAASGEVFCRHWFGRRYAPMLLASFGCCCIFLFFFGRVVPQAYPGLIGVYLFIYFILVLVHLVQMWGQRPTIHSYSSGQSWELWSRFNFNPTVVKLLIEPFILVLIGHCLFTANEMLSLWIQFSGLCLFSKEVMSKWRFRNRVMDSIDARLEGERIGTGVRQQTTPQGGRGQGANQVTMAAPAQSPDNAPQQMYSGLDPALQQLIRTPNQTQPNPTISNRTGTPLVIIRNQSPTLRPRSGFPAAPQAAENSRSQRQIVRPATPPVNSASPKNSKNKTK